MEVQAGRGPAVANGMLQGIDGEPGGAVVGHAPAHHSTGELIDDDGQVTPCTCDLQVSDIAMPDLIDSSDAELADTVGHLLEELQVRSLAHEEMIGSTLQTCLSHEASHTMASDAHAPVAQLLHDARRAIDLATSLMSLEHQGTQRLIPKAASTLRSSQPSIKARTGDLHDVADHRERERFAVCFDEGEDLAFSSEANRMAFFRMSCSICRRWNWRSTSRKRLSSATASG